MKKRIIATILSIALMITSVPWTALDVFAATQLDVTDKVADADTTDQWKNYFGEQYISTEFAGAVWTDKSVFADDVDNNTDGTQVKVDNQTFTIDEDNFLVALSALSSTKQITGYSYLPTDTVLVLDFSGSMNDDEMRSMVAAANKAIDTLYETSEYNRVGVAVYNIDAHTLMPIDRYEKSGSDWITFRTSGDSRYVEVAQGVTHSNNTTLTASVEGHSGTFTQGGMQEGLNLFTAVKDTEIKVGNIQGGTKRIPVMVLMTDGDPTSGSSKYIAATNENRDIGEEDYAETTTELVFLAQLTAANVHNQMEAHYGRECLFYTLGFGVSGEYAPQMLNPENTGTTTAKRIDTLWNTYANTGKDGEVCVYEGTYKRREITVSVKRLTDSDDGIKLKASRYYTDEYFPASNTAGLEAAFESIVREIILQSRYYPTLVSEGQHDVDGYVTIIDELGEHMHMQEIEGLIYGNTVFTGEALLRAMGTGQYGNASQWSEYGWELVESIKERLDVASSGDNTDKSDSTESNVELGTPIEVTNDVVIDLIQKAWEDGQISYTYNDANSNNKLDDTETVTSFSNYISYYVNAEGKYLGFHYKDHTSADYPNGTKYIGRSYLFQGKISDNTTGSLEGSELMHIVVQVYEDVDNGHQTVTYRVPASLIPQVYYEISVKGDVLNADNVDKIKYTEDTPIRLVYEVGLCDELTPINLVEKMKQAAHSHPVNDNTTGAEGYYFYSNRWGEGTDVTYLDPNGHKATVAHFSPSVENERYYFAEDSILYVYEESDNSYVAYTGDTLPGDKEYYRELKYITTSDTDAAKSADGAAASMTSKFVPVDSSVAKNAFKTSDKKWYVEKGTMYQAVARLGVAKDKNKTGTLDYVDFPRIYHPTGENVDYDVFVFHGNNGRLKVMPATGLKVTKGVNVASTVSGANNNFEFIVEFTNASVPADVKITDSDYNALTAGTDYVIEDKKVILKNITDGETVYITGLAADTVYTVKESANEYYIVQSVTAETVNNNVAGGTIEANKIDAVEFVNTASSFKGNLQISKTVTHDYGPNYDVKSKGKVFDVVVTLTDKDGNAITSTTGLEIKGTTNNGTSITEMPTPDSNGKFVLTMGHEDSVTITGLPHGANYNVSEDSTTMPNGFSLDTTNSTNLTGKIATDKTVHAHLVNDYTATPATAADITAEITKVLDGRNWESGDKFEFVLESYVNGSWVAVKDSSGNPITAKITNSSTDHKIELSGSNDVKFTTIGTYHCRIREVKPENPIDGITYDETARYYHVEVKDDDMDGNLTLEVKDHSGVTVTKPAENSYKLEVEFTNRYNSTTANINIQKILENDTGIDIPMSEFSFGLYTKDVSGALVPVMDNKDTDDTSGDKAIVVKPNVKGDVIIPVTYASTDNRFVADGEQTAVSYDAANENNVSIANDEESYIKTSEVGASFSQSYKFTDVYYLKEIVPATTRVGMTYSDAEIKVEITVNKTEKTTYTATKSVKVNSSADTPNINNLVEWTEDGNTATYTEKEDTRQTIVTNLTSSVKYYNESNEDWVEITSPATFNNKYEIDGTSTVIGGTKEYNRDIPADKFKFNLYKADNTFTIDASAEIKTVTAAATAATEGVARSEFSFPEISYTKAGTYYYVVKENLVVTKDETTVEATAENNYTVDGITYDPTVYHITVVVGKKADDDGNDKDDLYVESTTVNQVGGSGNSIVFNNTYSITGTATAEISVNKVLTGRALNSGEFTFHLYNKDDVIIDSGAVAVKDDATPLQTATNSAYNTVDGTKYTGTVVFEDVGSYTQTGAYEQTGTYEYVIVEDKSYVKGGVTYDETPYVYAKVEVKDNGDGTLATEVTYSADGVTYGTATAAIENSYSATPVTISIRGDKRYVDENNNKFDLTEYGEFKFLLQPANDKYVVDTTKTAIEMKNGVNPAAKDQFAFDLTYDTKGTYYYVLREEPGTSVTTVYDAAVYHVMVVVQDNGEGALTAVTNVTDLHGNHIVFDWDSTLTEDAQKRAEFVNIEKSVDPIDVTFNIKKAITKLGTADHTLANFEFEVRDGATGTVYKDKNGNNPTSGVDGKTAFSVTYDKDDIGEEYVYIISELNTDIKDMEYDTTEFQIVVKVDYVAEQLVTTKTLTNLVTGASAVVDDVELNFNNKYSGNVTKYDPPVDPGKTVHINPNTGDETNNTPYIALMAASAVGLIAVLFLMKKKKDEEDGAET